MISFLTNMLNNAAFFTNNSDNTHKCCSCKTALHKINNTCKICFSLLCYGPECRLQHSDKLCQKTFKNHRITLLREQDGLENLFNEPYLLNILLSFYDKEDEWLAQKTILELKDSVPAYESHAQFDKLSEKLKNDPDIISILPYYRQPEHTTSRSLLYYASYFLHHGRW